MEYPFQDLNPAIYSTLILPNDYVVLNALHLYDVDDVDPNNINLVRNLQKKIVLTCNQALTAPDKYSMTAGNGVAQVTANFQTETGTPILVTGTIQITC